MSKPFSKNKDKRDSGGFVALLHPLLDSAAYRSLGYAARCLLTDIARQYKGHNNGCLVACDKYLKPLGWSSHQTISSSLKQLMEVGLIIRTRLGMKPNKAAWYALAWYEIDPIDGMDMKSNHYNLIRQDWKKYEPIKALIPKTGVSKS
jgi:hypothetical protein